MQNNANEEENEAQAAQADDGMADAEERRLRRIVSREEMTLAKWLWYGGFVMLPFLWLLSHFTFRKKMERTDLPDEFRSYVQHTYKAFWVAMALWVAYLVAYYVGWHQDAAWTHTLLMFEGTRPV